MTDSCLKQTLWKLNMMYLWTKPVCLILKDSVILKT